MPARRALDVLDRQRGRRHADADRRAQRRVLAGHRDRRRDRRRRHADPRGEPARDVRRRGQRRIAFLLRIELAERRQVVVVRGRDEPVAGDLGDDRRDVVAAAGGARRGDSSVHRLGDRVRLRHEQRERRIADEAVQTVAAQQHAIAAAQLDDRQRRLDIVADAERLQDRRRPRSLGLSWRCGRPRAAPTDSD